MYWEKIKFSPHALHLSSSSVTVLIIFLSKWYLLSPSQIFSVYSYWLLSVSFVLQFIPTCFIIRMDISNSWHFIQETALPTSSENKLFHRHHHSFIYILPLISAFTYSSLHFYSSYFNLKNYAAFETSSTLIIPILIHID